jgi:hypothetical protein
MHSLSMCLQFRFKEFTFLQSNTQERHFNEIKKLLKKEVSLSNHRANLSFVEEETLAQGSIAQPNDLMDVLFAGLPAPRITQSDGIEAEMIGYRMEPQIDRSKN